jgi:hypothetical protein
MKGNVPRWAAIEVDRLLQRHPGAHVPLRDALAHIGEGCEHVDTAEIRKQLASDEFEAQRMAEAEGTNCPLIAAVPAVTIAVGLHPMYLRGVWHALNAAAREAAA